MAETIETVNIDYEYMNETNIDDELKCIICRQPFQNPVSLTCQHTFCLKCIDLWLNEHESCPTCRELIVCENDNKYLPINTQIINKQLDRLLVRCNQCYETNIQRGNFIDHEKKCLKQLVHCPSMDIKCPWRGRRDEQDVHISQCAFHQIRPIIDHFNSQLDLSLTVQHRLQKKVEYLSKQIKFLFSIINHGNIMTQQCSKSFNQCQYAMYNRMKSNVTFYCLLCQHVIHQRRNVSLHACSLNNQINCICGACYESQYSAVTDSTPDEEE